MAYSGIRWMTCDTCDKLSRHLTNVGGLAVCGACLPKYPPVGAEKAPDHAEAH